jgi:hypothetical protein
MVYMLCNRRLIVLQAKIPAGASEAAGTGHQTDGELSENTIRGKRNRKRQFMRNKRHIKHRKKE